MWPARIIRLDVNLARHGKEADDSTERRNSMNLHYVGLTPSAPGSWLHPALVLAVTVPSAKLKELNGRKMTGGQTQPADLIISRVAIRISLSVDE